MSDGASTVGRHDDEPAPAPGAHTFPAFVHSTADQDEVSEPMQVLSHPLPQPVRLVVIDPDTCVVSSTCRWTAGQVRVLLTLTAGLYAEAVDLMPSLLRVFSA